ncbi:hypothetical protein GCM10020256_51720 [Streptomyces thermocoprophilus]
MTPGATAPGDGQQDGVTADGQQGRNDPSVQGVQPGATQPPIGGDQQQDGQQELQ